LLLSYIFEEHKVWEQVRWTWPLWPTLHSSRCTVFSCCIYWGASCSCGHDCVPRCLSLEPQHWSEVRNSVHLTGYSLYHSSITSTV